MKQRCTATLVAFAALTCADVASAQPRPRPAPVAPVPVRPMSPPPVVVRSQPSTPVYVNPPRAEPARPYYPPPQPSQPSPPRPEPVRPYYPPQPQPQPVVIQPGPARPAPSLPQPVVVQPGPARPAPSLPQPVQPVIVQPSRPGYVGIAPPPRPVVVAPMPVRPLPVATPIRVRVAPPPMRTEMMPRSPGAGYFWVSGHWHWDGGQYIWVPGHWDLPPHPQAVWIPARWVMVNGYYEYTPGRWQYGNSYPPGYVQPGPGYVQQPMAMNLEPNTRVSGMLQQGDQILPHGAYGDDYSINLQPGQTITLIANGGPSYTRPGGRLDVLMQVLQNGAVVAQDDDSAGNLDSRIDFTPQVPGLYVVRVTTYNGGYEQGAYTLQSWVQSIQPAVVEVQPQPQPQQLPMGPEVQIGTAFTGSLDQGDLTYSDGSVADDYTLNLVAGQPVTIVVRGGPASDGSGQSIDVTATLLRNEQSVATDDDSAGYPNARIVYVPQETGAYRLRINAFGQGFHGGAYTVQTWSGAYSNAQ